MTSDSEIIKILKRKDIKIPIFIQEGKILVKALWILKICKDNTPASRLSLSGISNIAHEILDDYIKENSLSKAFSRAGNKIRRWSGGFYEIMGPGRKELDKKMEEIKEQEKFREKFYNIGDQFDFYLDVKQLISGTSQKIFIIDSWINEDLLEVYLAKVPTKVKIKILTNAKNPKGNFTKVARMFSRQHKGKFEVRESPFCHDRAIFIDDLGWVFGQSIKDSAKNKPTYMIKLDHPVKLEKIYNILWNLAKKIV